MTFDRTVGCFLKLQHPLIHWVDPREVHPSTFKSLSSFVMYQVAPLTTKRRNHLVKTPV